MFYSPETVLYSNKTVFYSYETEFSSRMHYPAFGYDVLLPTLAYVSIKARYGPKFTA